jgi:hypothetical protein
MAQGNAEPMLIEIALISSTTTGRDDSPITLVSSPAFLTYINIMNIKYWI